MVPARIVAFAGAAVAAGDELELELELLQSLLAAAASIAACCGCINRCFGADAAAA